ncbi:putative ribonucleoside-diphosphate reductase small chain B [Lentinus tigrinus ALCF2SS1-7]|uniref:Putative ribonucleoside-diphosphate reductase small chain B n=1 Tax=Lentinus tigrinus ALCF2SS1-6 TaxID=1328759 RepID=A0A5C2RR25_9APHY|nr:putative ribonucleoside-diphosphate reductase small chain B [Lentinus tigrinus ALCF2SS1-6]RPD70529.1 putative ribonucleoside-diphosphate reductase small chain B [Lentinus tigrinus ALCF2SS1-7]
MEPILVPNVSRFVLFPIKYPKVWNMYKTAQASFWTAEEITKLNVDVEHWQGALTNDERTFFSTILAFFAASDGIVVENLAQRFCAEVQIPEARCFYGFQMMMENVHSETYSMLLRALVDDESEQARLFSAIETMPTVKAKADWCIRWIESSSSSFAVRLVAFAIVEGIFFSSSFAAIFWVRSRGLLPALSQSNEFIARDEGLHTSFACLLYSHLHNGLTAEFITSMVMEAVDLEYNFFESALPRPLAGMNVQLMREYIQYVGDFLLEGLGVPPCYGSRNPFVFMETTVVGSRANFFERRVSEYVGASVRGV